MTKKILLTFVVSLLILTGAFRAASADMAKAMSWISSEFQPSTLTACPLPTNSVTAKG